MCTYNFLAVMALGEVLVRCHKESVRHLLSTLQSLINPQRTPTPHLCVVGAEDGWIGDTISHLQTSTVVGNAIGTLLMVVLLASYTSTNQE